LAAITGKSDFEDKILGFELLQRAFQFLHRLENKS